MEALTMTLETKGASEGAAADRFLVASADKGAELRLRALVDDHFAFVGRVLKGLGVLEADVDDACQQVFLVAARRIDDVAVGAERSFLFQTAVRVASRARRGRARRREDGDEVLDGAPDVSATPEELADRRRARAVLDAILEDMPMELRTVFVLFEIEELSTPQIAEMLDLKLGTVASRLRRAREDFEARVARHRAREKSAKGGVR